jgi:hypothetical protein
VVGNGTMSSHGSELNIIVSSLYHYTVLYYSVCLLKILDILLIYWSLVYTEYFSIKIKYMYSRNIFSL